MDISPYSAVPIPQLLTTLRYIRQFDIELANPALGTICLAPRDFSSLKLRKTRTLHYADLASIRGRVWRLSTRFGTALVFAKVRKRRVGRAGKVVVYFKYPQMAAAGIPQLESIRKNAGLWVIGNPWTIDFERTVENDVALRYVMDRLRTILPGKSGPPDESTMPFDADMRYVAFLESLLSKRGPAQIVVAEMESDRNAALQSYDFTKKYYAQLKAKLEAAKKSAESTTSQNSTLAE